MSKGPGAHNIMIPGGTPGFLSTFARSVQEYVLQFFSAPLGIGVYAAANLPDPARFRGCLIFVPDESGGATVAFSDGTNWRRVQDRAIVT